MRTRPALAAAGLRAGLGLWLCLAGCNDNELGPGIGNGQGTGTHTLTVAGSASALPRHAEAHAAADFAVSFSVRVSLDRLLVTTGSVTVTSATGKVPLTFHDDAGCPGWSGQAIGYDEVYVLDVVTDGTHKVEGVRVDGPTSTLAALRPEPANWITIDDSGSYALPAGAFWSNDSSARLHTLRLARTNQVVPEDATQTRAGASRSRTTSTSSTRRCRSDPRSGRPPVIAAAHFMYLSTLRWCSASVRANAWLRASLATK